MDLVPIYRNEFFLDAIVNNSVNPYSPEYRVEYYLAKIAGENVTIPDPTYRIEFYLAYLCGEEVELPDPIYRIEYYLAFLCGLNVAIPDPIYRVEFWLFEWCGGSAISKTIIGNPIHITDALAKPVQALSVKLEPIQDLNGYDSPWPEGGGKNLVNINGNVVAENKNPDDTYSFSQGEVVDGLEVSGYCRPAYLNFTVNGNSVDVEATSAGYGLGLAFAVQAGEEYTCSSSDNNRKVVVYFDEDKKRIGASSFSTGAISFTAPPSASYACFVLSPATTNTVYTYTDIQVEIGSTASAWTPYSNICPITGHTDADVVRTGANLYPYSEIPQYSYYWYAGSTELANAAKPYFIKGGQSYVFSYSPSLAETATAQLRVWRADGTILFNEKEVLKAKMLSETSDYYLFTWQATPQYYSAPRDSTANAILIQPTEDLWIDMTLQSNKGVGNNPMLAVGSTASDYQPYVGTTYPIPLGQTVYGGQLDVLAGKVYARPYYPSYNGETLVGPWVSSMDKYEEGATPTTGAQVVDMGGTVTEISLTPTEVTLLLGENNIFSDGEMTLTYLADGNASDEEALNILLGGRYVNNHGEDEPTDREALDILLGGTR